MSLNDGYDCLIIQCINCDQYSYLIESFELASFILLFNGAIPGGN